MVANGRGVLRDLRRARRKNRGTERDWLEAWYELWLRGFVAIGIVIAVGALLRGDPLSASAVHRFRADAPGIASVIVALASWVALRSGARGAPLAPEAPDVRYLLLAPIPRSKVLRPMARRQLRSSITAVAVAGMAAGLAAAPRLPAGPGSWSLAGAAAGACLGAALWGTVALTSARRLAPLTANAIALTLVSLATLDALDKTFFSPTSWISALAFLPMRAAVPSAAAAAGVALAISVPALAIVAIGGTSLEPLLGRSALVSQMRFAASLQDMRTVVLLHRQLASEGARRRPWLRLRAQARVVRPAWRRAWHGYVRWPAARIARLVLLAASAVVLGFAVSSTRLVIVAAGAATFVAALDLIEPFAAELDHPMAILTYGVSIRAVLLRNLVTPVLTATAIGLATAGIAAWFAPGHAALVVSVATSGALAALAGASLNVALGPPPASQLVNAMMLPEIYGMVLVTRQALPPAIAIAWIAPLAVAPAAGDATAVALAVGVSAAAIATIAYAGLRGV